MDVIQIMSIIEKEEKGELSPRRKSPGGMSPRRRRKSPRRKSPTVIQLKSKAKKLGLVGYSKLNKSGLLRLVRRRK